MRGRRREGEKKAICGGCVHFPPTLRLDREVVEEEGERGICVSIVEGSVKGEEECDAKEGNGNWIGTEQREKRKEKKTQ